MDRKIRDSIGACKCAPNIFGFFNDQLGKKLEVNSGM